MTNAISRTKTAGRTRPKPKAVDITSQSNQDSLSNMPDILTVAEVAEYLRLSRNGVYEALRQNAIPHTRIGKRILIPKSALRQMLDAASVAVAA